jgi:hypothetical protein
MIFISPIIHYHYSSETHFGGVGVFHLFFFGVLGLVFWQWASYRFKRNCGRVDHAPRKRDKDLEHQAMSHPGQAIGTKR